MGKERKRRAFASPFSTLQVRSRQIDETWSGTVRQSGAIFIECPKIISFCSQQSEILLNTDADTSNRVTGKQK